MSDYLSLIETKQKKKRHYLDCIEKGDWTLRLGQWVTDDVYKKGNNFMILGIHPYNKEKAWLATGSRFFANDLILNQSKLVSEAGCGNKVNLEDLYVIKLITKAPIDERVKPVIIKLFGFGDKCKILDQLSKESEAEEKIEALSDFCTECHFRKPKLTILEIYREMPGGEEWPI